MTIGEYLKIEIESRGWDLARFASEMGVKQPYATRLVNDQPKRSDGSAPIPGPETIKKIATALKVNSRSIFNQVYSPFLDDDTSVTIQPYTRQEIELNRLFRLVPAPLQPDAITIIKSMAAIGNSARADVQEVTPNDVRSLNRRVFFDLDTHEIFTQDGQPLSDEMRAAVNVELEAFFFDKNISGVEQEGTEFNKVTSE